MKEIRLILERKLGLFLGLCTKTFINCIELNEILTIAFGFYSKCKWIPHFCYRDDKNNLLEIIYSIATNCMSLEFWGKTNYIASLILGSGLILTTLLFGMIRKQISNEHAWLVCAAFTKSWVPIESGYLLNKTVVSVIFVAEIPTILLNLEHNLLEALLQDLPWDNASISIWKSSSFFSSNLTNCL